MRKAWLYILSSRSGVLYVGVTSDLPKRVWEHKTKKYAGFTSKYNVDRLVFYEEFPTPLQAIRAEKSVKGWLRAKKIALIESLNPTWRDLSDGWYGRPLPGPDKCKPPSPPPLDAERHPERSEGPRAG